MKELLNRKLKQASGWLSGVRFDLYKMATVPVSLEENICWWWNQATFPCCKVAVLMGLPDLSITGAGEQSWGRGAAKRGWRLRQGSPVSSYCHPAPSVPAAVTPGCGSSLMGSGSRLSILPQQCPVNERGFFSCCAQHSI